MHTIALLCVNRRMEGYDKRLVKYLDKCLGTAHIIYWRWKQGKRQSAYVLTTHPVPITVTRKHVLMKGYVTDGSRLLQALRPAPASAAATYFSQKLHDTPT